MEKLEKEAYGNIIADSQEKDEAIQELKSAVVKITSIVEEEKAKAEEDEEKADDTKKVKSDKKTDNDVEVEKEMKDDDETDDEDEETEECDTPKKGKAMVKESLDIDSIRDRIRARIVEEQS